MHRALEISEANATPYISKSSGISRKQKTGIERSRYPNRAVTPIEQSLHKTIPKSASPITGHAIGMQGFYSSKTPVNR